MQYAVQPAGTTPAQALINRGADPELFAPNNYAFFKSCRLMIYQRVQKKGPDFCIRLAICQQAHFHGLLCIH